MRRVVSAPLGFGRAALVRSAARRAPGCGACRRLCAPPDLVPADLSPADLALAGPAALQEHAIPGTVHGGRKMIIVFTCVKCETRSAKKFSKASYDGGVVLVKCPGCKKYHLIADRLGFFEDGPGGWDVEKLAAMRGERVQTISDQDVDDNVFADLTPDQVRELILGHPAIKPHGAA
ncbi:DNL zinc finger-domain-containing protein [Pelagophyceae sp. CCMP2097]|nr:DNL zinc finger-domain-containing protein [Pelagophyceae sp. CCMP2097]